MYIACRCLIWADVAKLARKHHIWDVGILSSLYCIEFDNATLTSSGIIQYTHTHTHNYFIVGIIILWYASLPPMVSASTTSL